MKILLTMAGLGSRFKNAGFVDEKYAIQFRGHSLLEWSLASLLNFRDSDLILITRDFPGVSEHLQRAVDYLGFSRSRTIVIESLTRGQAETAALAHEAFVEDEPILIFNTDTFIDPDFLRPEDIRGDGWLPTFTAPGDKWSFAEANGDGLVIRTTEKVRISDHCSVGLYYFSSFFDYVNLLGSNINKSQELYVAPLYNQWIREGHKTYIHSLPSEAVTVLGTPEDLALADSQGTPAWPDKYFKVG